MVTGDYLGTYILRLGTDPTVQILQIPGMVVDKVEFIADFEMVYCYGLVFLVNKGIVYF